MKRNRLSKITITCLLLTLALFAYGCQSDQATPTETTKEEEEMQEVESQNEIETVSINEIRNITWQWTDWVEKDSAAQSVVPDPENYNLIFWDDMSFSAKIDCNVGNGSYTVEGNRLEFGPIMTTMAMCEPGSLHDQYLAFLGQVDTFGMAGDTLVITLKEAGGEMHFINSGPAEKPLTPTEESESIVPEVKIIFVGPEKVDCVGVGPMECYQIKEDPDGEWQLFYGQVEGFEWEPSYTYELRVAIYPVENPPADAPSLRYELIEMLDKTETPVEPGQKEAYIRIKEPLTDSELDASKPIVVSGMGAGLFEGNVVVQILDSEENELAVQPTIIQAAEAGMGAEGPWETEINLSIVAPTEGKIVAFSPSPKDGEGWIASDEVAVTLIPGMEMGIDTSFEETDWILRSFAQQEDINTLLTVYQVTARFNPQDGNIGGVAGCNNYFSGYTLDGDQLTIQTPVGTTRMMCPEPQMVLENAYLAALEEIASFEINQKEMVIHDRKGNPLLIFQVDAYSLSESFTRQELANTSYLNEFAETGIAQLVDGMYREAVTEDSATELIMMLTTYAAFSDLNGDGSEDAVVVLVSQPGGSGSFFDLAIVRKQDEALTNMARVLLGDRVQINSLQIENGEIVVDMLTQGPNDPMCCPTQHVREYYVLESGELALISSEIIE